MSATDILGKIGEKVGGQIKSLESSITNDFATKAELGTLQSEVDANQTGAGLGTGGVYTANASSNYLATASSLLDADNKLDAQVKLNETAASTNASAINTIEASAGLSAAGAYQADSGGDYISSATSLADADSLLDDQVKTNTDGIATNTSNISSLSSSKLDVAGGSITNNLTIGGNLTVSGTTTTINTSELKVEDNTIEVNLKSDGSETAQTAGLNVNRGVDGSNVALDKAGLIWDDANSTWTLVLGSAAADLNAATITASLTGDVTGNLLAPDGDGVKINNVSLGDYSTFESAFNTAVA